VRTVRKRQESFPMQREEISFIGLYLSIGKPGMDDARTTVRRGKDEWSSFSPLDIPYRFNHVLK